MKPVALLVMLTAIASVCHDVSAENTGSVDPTMLMSGDALSPLFETADGQVGKTRSLRSGDADATGAADERMNPNRPIHFHSHPPSVAVIRLHNIVYRGLEDPSLPFHLVKIHSKFYKAGMHHTVDFKIWLARMIRTRYKDYTLQFARHGGELKTYADLLRINDINP